ncbi:universal stress protein [Ramlibacter sp.]|uniref:universal stress protein n=1 Tax=Ramlibacter sp. TaxID=1917967 RepID=UPI003D0B3271
MFKHILLATDGSAASERAARAAVDLAREQSAVLTAVYVVDPYPYLGIGDTNPLGLHAYLGAARDHAAEAHARVLQLAEQSGKKLDVRLRLLEDVTAAKGILAAAKEAGADVIVAGSHGRTGLDNLLLGSVAAKLAALSPVSVLIVR